MKIINLTRENAQLQFYINELIIFKNSLIETCKRLTVNDFQERIYGISKDEALELASTIEKIIDLPHQNSDFRLESQSIQIIQLIENQVTIQISYKIIRGLRSILNELCHGIHVEDFQSKIGFDKTSVSNLLDSIHSNVVEKMQENSPESIIHKKTIEISNTLNLKISNLEAKSLCPRVKTTCLLKLKSHLITFFLASLSNRKIFSGIQIAIGKQPHHADFLTKYDPQGIRHSDLVRLVAYLELVLTSAISNTDLEKFTLSLFNSQKKSLFDIQVFSNCIESQSVRIRFRLYPSNQEEITNDSCLDIEDASSVSDIYSFTMSIRKFLSKLPTEK